MQKRAAMVTPTPGTCVKRDAAVEAAGRSAQFTRCCCWRRERDSNPRNRSRFSGFQDHRHRPLGHLSAFLGKRGTSRSCYAVERMNTRPADPDLPRGLDDFPAVHIRNERLRHRNRSGRRAGAGTPRLSSQREGCWPQTAAAHSHGHSVRRCPRRHEQRLMRVRRVARPS